ncbi:MAG: CBS domain-containing protein [Deltaproteobacteria bacterium]|nr:CBS domain-containing protein [Deltaproteobacteria bacterium]
MVVILLAIALVALGLRAIAAGGSAALYAPLAPRTAASLEAGAAVAAVVAAGASGLALLVSTDGMSVVALAVLAVAPVAVLVADLLPRALAQAQRRVLPAPIRTFAHRTLALACTPLRWIESGVVVATGGRGDRWIPTLGQVLSDLLRRERPGEDVTLSSPQFIRRIFRFRETRVREVMIPLIHIYAVRDDAPIEEALALATREKVSRVPVFQQRMYNIIGVVHVFDLLGETRLGEPVRTIMRPPLYVPENRLAHQQLRLMQRRGVNLAVVVDEYGGTVGIVTVEDLLEEIVGEIEDEYDEREVLFERRSDGAVRVEGAMEVDRLNEIFPWLLPAGDYETIAGLVVTHLGRVPRAGVRVKLARVTIEVTRADARAVREVIVHAIAAG